MKKPHRPSQKGLADVVFCVRIKLSWKTLKRKLSIPQLSEIINWFLYWTVKLNCQRMHPSEWPVPSLRNWINYLEAAVKCVFIKSTNYEAQKTKKFRDQIGRIENMKYDRDEDCFICADGRKLRCHKESTQMQDGIPVTRAWYRCESCENCPQRERCCRKQDINAPKEVIWKKTFWEKREDSLRNITSDRGIMLRMNRSIQVEGAFGLLKNDFSFRRFMTTGKRNIRIELFFLALGFNLKKRWMKQQKSRLETHYSEKKAS